MPHGFAHLPDLARSAFVNGERQHGLIASRPKPDRNQVDPGGRRAPAVDHDAPPEALERVFIGHAAHPGVIDALDFVPRMQEPGRQCSVVRQDEQPFRVIVETADRIHVVADVADQLHDRSPSAGVRAGGEIPSGLVEQDVAEAPRRLNAPPIHPDVVSNRVRPGSKLRHDRPVDRDASLSDECFGGSPRRHAGRRKDLLQPHTSISIVHVLSRARRHRRSKSAKNETRPQTSETVGGRSISACVMIPLKSVRVRVLPDR